MAAIFGLLQEDGGTTVAGDEMDHVPALQEADDPDTSPWRLAALASHVDPAVRIAVAVHRSTSALTILRLRRDLDARVRVVVSARRETPR